MATESRTPQRTEREQFEERLAQETERTLRLMRAFPADQPDFRPHPRSKTAKDLAWMFTMELNMIASALSGSIPLGQRPPAPPATYDEVVAEFEQTVGKARAAVAAASDAAFERTFEWPTGPGQVGTMRAMDILWYMLMDQIHHRGQFSVYVRMAGGKVTSIYGPTADEPWR
jgi:uncharacterized damage-inducible protein DinB